jgi:hypothetical protein
MLPEVLLIITLATNILILIFLIYYIFSLRTREKKLEIQEDAVDTDYHHVVNEALNKERAILTDATSEADQIIKGANYLSNASKQEVSNAIRTLVLEIQKEGQIISQAFSSEYTSSLKGLSQQSLNEFQVIMTTLQNDLKKQINEFHITLMPQVEKELEAYKQTRLKEIDKAVTDIIQKASQDLFNKTISTTDHQNLIIQSLEKAKKEGVFD